MGDVSLNQNHHHGDVEVAGLWTSAECVKPAGVYVVAASPSALSTLHATDRRGSRLECFAGGWGLPIFHGFLRKGEGFDVAIIAVGITAEAFAPVILEAVGALSPFAPCSFARGPGPFVSCALSLERG